MLAQIQAFRTTLASVALAAAMLTSGYAVAGNHDSQAIKLSPTALAHHDRAPGPAPCAPD